MFFVLNRVRVWGAGAHLLTQGYIELPPVFDPCKFTSDLLYDCLQLQRTSFSSHVLPSNRRFERNHRTSKIVLRDNDAVELDQPRRRRRKRVMTKQLALTYNTLFGRSHDLRVLTSSNCRKPDRNGNAIVTCTSNNKYDY